MSMDKISGKEFREMLESGCANLNNRRKDVDALNVFPVPDGDTGTNMSLTFTSGISEVRNAGSNDLPVITKTLSRGMLMGARGNSGVILSQIFRGFNSAVGGKTELGAADFSACMTAGSAKAYRAVMRPVEGTILTVVRESSETAAKYVEENPECSLNDYMDVLCKEARASLDRTPDLLPVLKEANCVDSGGRGLLQVFNGFRKYLEGSPVKESDGEEDESKEEVKNGYCTELILKLNDKYVNIFNQSKVRDSLSKIASNITVVVDEGIVKMRATTMTPGDILNLGQRYGEFEKVQIFNLALEDRPSILEEKKQEVKEEPAEEKEFGMITCCAGDGLASLFKDYKVDVVVSGGQTMNPSTEDFVSAIGRINAKHIYILPNNSNIIMAAKQAAALTEGKDVIVLETTSVPQGLSACIMFNPEDDTETNTQAMKDAIASVKSGSVTYAIKDTSVSGREIHAGDFMGICEKEIVLTNPDKLEAACQLIKEMCDEDSEIITLIQGADATDAETAALKHYIEQNFEVDIDVEKGGQPVYSFIIGVE